LGAGNRAAPAPPVTPPPPRKTPKRVLTPFLSRASCSTRATSSCINRPCVRGQSDCHTGSNSASARATSASPIKSRRSRDTSSRTSVSRRSDVLLLLSRADAPTATAPGLALGFAVKRRSSCWYPASSRTRRLSSISNCSLHLVACARACLSVSATSAGSRPMHLICSTTNRSTSPAGRDGVRHSRQLRFCAFWQT
jgi:hypothetical protein